MTEAISAHKKMAMGITEGNAMKKSGGVRKYAEGGKVMPEKGVDTLINKGAALKPNLAKDTKIATYKNGGSSKKGMGIAILLGGPPMKRSSGRGK
jgi:hypothetical protein